MKWTSAGGGRPKGSLTRAFTLHMILLATLAVSTCGYLWITSEIRRFHREAAELRERLIEDRQQTLRREVNRAVDFIHYKKSQTKTRLKEEIRNRTYQAYATAKNLYDTYGEDLPRTEIERMVKEALRPIRFNNGRGYYFATRLDGVEQLFADRPDLEGEDLLDMRDTQGKYVIRDMIRIARTEKEGYYRYTWTKPNTTGRHFSKIAFIKYFAPFDWLIGTGEYVDDVTADIQKEAMERIANRKYGRAGYLFAGRWDGTSLSGPARGQNMIDITDVNGVRIVRQLIAAARQGGGFVRYTMPALEGQRSAPKLSYAAGIADWHWYVGAGVYIDDIDRVIEQRQAAIYQDLKKQVLYLVLTLTALLGGIALAARYMARKTGSSLALFASFFRKAATASVSIDPGALHFTEFALLADSANRMIEAQKAAESATKESEGRYRTLFNAVGDPIFLVRESRFIDCNQKTLEVFDCTREQIIGKAVADFSPPRQPDGTLSAEAAAEKLASALAGRPQQFLWTHARFDGTPFWAEVHLNRIVLEGAPLILAIVRDITERQETQQALAESEERFRELAELLPEAIFEMDTKGRLTFVNQKAYDYFGYSPNDFSRSLKALDMIDAEDRAKTTEHIAQLVEGESLGLTELTAVRKDGTRFPAMIHVAPAFRNGHSAGFRGFIIDITDKKNMEIRLRQAQKMEAIGTLAGGIAHDFNNILSAILGYSELAMGDANPGSLVHGHLLKIFKAGKRARDLVKQILTFSRQADQNLMPVRIDPIIKEAFKLLRASLPTTIAMNLSLEAEPTVMADPTQIHQVLMNLATNAAHAMRGTGGVLDIRLSEEETGKASASGPPEIRPGRMARISVSDTGHGIAPETRERIFDPFFTTKPKGEGTGMGLSVVHGIVESHGGTIEIQSRPYEGTTFHVLLPAVGPEQVDETQGPLAMPTGSERILFLDDEDFQVDLGRQMLEKLGYRVTTFTESLRALEWFRENAPGVDLVITDMTMPQMTGDDLARAVMTLRPEVPVILCTGFSDRIGEEQAKRLGIAELALKPIALRDLAVVVRRVLDRAGAPGPEPSD